MTVLNNIERQYYEHAKASVPKWFRQHCDWLLVAFARQFALAHGISVEWLDKQAHLDTATGPDANPDWLALHARDQNTDRQQGEDSETLRTRLQTPSSGAVTQAILDAVTETLTIAGVTDPAFIVEIPRAKANFGDYTSQSDVGLSFDFTTPGAFTIFPIGPSILLGAAPWYQVMFGRSQLVVTGATDTENNATNEVNGYIGDAMWVDDYGGVTAVDYAAAWTLEKIDADGNVIDGRNKAYLGRGYRMANRGMLIIAILPYGTTEDTAAAVAEVIRKKKPAGVRSRVERRTVP